jgi:hypothetical protein
MSGMLISEQQQWKLERRVKILSISTLIAPESLD